MQSKDKLLLKNTIMLYMRTLVVMIVSLYTVRVIYKTLGVSDYGIQNVVSGFVTMFTFVTGSLSITISRFLSIEIGANNHERLKNVFVNSMYCMALVGFFLFFLIELIGIPLLNVEMNIPSERMYAANWVLQLSIFTLMIQIFTICYDALIISAEKMSIYAYISIFDVVLKLLVAYSIVISSFDKLITYSFLLMLQSFVILVIYIIYSKKNILQYKGGSTFNISIIKEIAGLTVWDLFGSSSIMLKNYGSNIILNLFFGPIINASRGIAMQINAALTKFSGGFLTALRPQILKAYAIGDKKRFFQLIDRGTRFSSYLLLLISLPIMLESHFIINLWLGNVPEHCVAFVVLIVILSISEGTLIYSHNTALMATGRIKKCQITTGLIQILNLPISYIALYYGAVPEITVIIAIFIAHICCFIRLFFLRKYTGYSIKTFFYSTYLKLFQVSLLSVSIPLFFLNFMAESYVRFISVCLISVLSTSVFILFVGCNRFERKKIIHLVLKKIYNQV